MQSLFTLSPLLGRIQVNLNIRHFSLQIPIYKRYLRMERDSFDDDFEEQSHSSAPYQRGRGRGGRGRGNQRGQS